MSRAPHICLADDDPAIRLATSEVLRSHSFRVTEAVDAASALMVIGREFVELLIADINMPGNEDLELLEHEAIASGHMPVLLITGDPSVATAVKALRLQVVDYITKPFLGSDLVARVTAGIEAGRRRRALATAAGHAGELKRLLQKIETIDAGGPPSEPPGLEGAATPDRWKLEPGELESLSQREREVIVEMVRGAGTKEIAERLFISPHTVRNHLKNVFRKLAVSSQVELICKVLGTAP